MPGLVSSKLLSELINELQDFQLSGKADEMPAFVVWLNQRFSTLAMPVVPPLKPGQAPIEGLIGQHLGSLYQTMRVLSKQALGEYSLHEFAMLATLFEFPNLTKSELVRKVRVEISSGIEMINRLIAQALIIELPNAQDKRAKILQLALEGQRLIIQMFEKMIPVGEHLVRDLDHTERMHLFLLLHKIDGLSKEKYEIDKPDDIAAKS